MTDIVHATPVQVPPGTGPRETSSIIMRMRIVNRCRELMVSGTYSPTLRQLASERITNKALRYHFPELVALHREALDDATRHGILKHLMPTGPLPSSNDCDRIIKVLVFREPLQ